ncbi:MAG: Mth938-like domain-containing protein, partial [Limnohabitans sp.]
SNWIAVNGKPYPHHLLVSAIGTVKPWLGHDLFNDIAEHSNTVLQTECEIVLIGCGKKQFFLPPHTLISFIHCGVGVETMDTAAACRTFNVLASEGRKVTAILLIEVADSPTLTLS